MTTPATPSAESSPALVRLLQIMERLRGPGGCPWDLEQTHQSIKPQLIEECYEVIEAIDSGRTESLREELGDVLLHVVFHAQLAREVGRFDFEDVAREIGDKLIRRHPHVFGEVSVAGTAEVLKNWDQIKRQEKPERVSLLEGIPRQLPSLMRAQETQKKAAKVGFDWPDATGPRDKVLEELSELQAEIQRGAAPDRVEDEFGDVLFSLVNYGRHLKMDAEQSLSRATSKFAARFQSVEQIVAASGRDWSDWTPAELDQLWAQAKETEVRTSPAPL